MQVIRTLTLGAALVLGATTVAAAQPPAAPRADREARAHARPHDRRGPRDRPAMRRRAEEAALLRGIQLSEAQRAQARAITERYRPQLQELVRRARPERAARGERPRARPDSAERAELRAQMAERMRTVQPQLQALRERQATELRAILTPEQQQTFDANRARRAEREARAQQSGERRPHRRPTARRGPGSR
ncbi:MAG TPA: Spy/CpxP family protein refolding chaperone [Gemmatimonadaceae bacterium]|nr:Spy/CpxP family protein refolding chaperone [Gemmatimonadaceae bacterium]